MSPPSPTDKATLTARSKRLSWLLRHGATETGLAMDHEGWADIDDVLRHVQLSFGDLLELVDTNEKKRFEIEGDHVRAVQGHSAGAPVTPEALEATWAVHAGREPLFHGTNIAAARAILGGEGIAPRARSHVHLAAAPDAKVGKRAQVEVLLVVDPARVRAAGFAMFEAPNGVILTRAVPREAIVDVRAAGARFEIAAGELRETLAR